MVYEKPQIYLLFKIRGRQLKILLSWIKNIDSKDLQNSYLCYNEDLQDDERDRICVILPLIKLQIEELGLTEGGLEKLIRASYHTLGLISYLTAGPKETKAWTITKGTKAPQAAGKIHSDFERGFIRAEIVSYEHLTACGSFNAAKEKGLVRSEGKEYVFQDGDIVLFRFNV